MPLPLLDLLAGQVARTVEARGATRSSTLFLVIAISFDGNWMDIRNCAAPGCICSSVICILCTPALAAGTTSAPRAAITFICTIIPSSFVWNPRHRPPRLSDHRGRAGPRYPHRIVGGLPGGRVVRAGARACAGGRSAGRISCSSRPALHRADDGKRARAPRDYRGAAPGLDGGRPRHLCSACPPEPYKRGTEDEPEDGVPHQPPPSYRVHGRHP